MSEPELDSELVEQNLEAYLQVVGRVIDELLNGTAAPGDKKWGFVLMAFPFNSDTGRCNYISNGQREDVITMLREQLSYFEGMAEAEPADPNRPQ